MGEVMGNEERDEDMKRLRSEPVVECACSLIVIGSLLTVLLRERET